MRRRLRAGVAPHDDAGWIEIVVQRFGFAQKLGAENDVLHAELFPDMDGVTDWDGGLNDDRRLDCSVRGAFSDEREHAFNRRAVEEVLFRVVIGRCGDNDQIRVAVSRRAVERGGKAQLARACPRIGKVLLDILVLDR